MGSCFSRSKGSQASSTQSTQNDHKITADDVSSDCRMGGGALQQQHEGRGQISANGNVERPPHPLPVAMATTVVERRPSFRLLTSSQAEHTVTVLATPREQLKLPRTNSQSRSDQSQRAVVTRNASSAGCDLKVAALFDSYRDADDDVILADGIERLCQHLSLDPSEFRVLVLAWKMNAGQMCRFTREEFTGGCKAMRVDSLRSLQSRLTELSDDVIHQPDTFKDLYRFTFRFGLDPAQHQRILPTEMAVLLWRLVFSNHSQPPPILERWLRFLECHPHVRGVPRDTWNMFLNFAESVGDDLSSYDDAEAWPSLFDDFVEFENDQANQNISKDKRGEGEPVIGAAVNEC
ncbi:LOW QUALITY PROTEIN: DCN1-like protein 3 [Nilaparvata lugens]|uniref:LOW QUALITY PROTEIN: DCN1-like protein 3 n=1 Tax=Nilaparvata lugens TaxID=108931 RepID=UPI00193D11A0|nr:LOW QUALITY PROTEIN: DCN1-like protein 3 [Nilaparvata lugens]